MRIISEESAKALYNNRSYTNSNTRVRKGVLYLHLKPIARVTDDGGLEISNQGYSTNVTKERLNAILETFLIPKYITQRQFAWYWDNGDEFESNKWIKVK